MSRKYIPFEDVEQLATIEQLADMLGLKTKPSGNQLRCTCPIHGGDDRAIAITPTARSKRGSLGVFYCQKVQSGGDRIGLVAHCMDVGQQDAAFFIAEQFGAEDSTVGASTSNSTVKSKERATVPQKTEGRANVPTKPEGFDPASIAAKLSYTEEVGALGISEEDAAGLGIGFHAAPGFLRGRVAFPIRNEAGAVVGYIGYQDGGSPPLKVPSRWHGIETNVVRFPKTA